jgi:hypothetical protein
VRRLAPALLALAALGGCGGSPVPPDFEPPTIPHQPASADDGAAGSATFTVDGQTIVVSQSGNISAQNGSGSPLNYTGPLGCRGRYFTANLTEHIRILFRYTRRDAYMLIGFGQQYHFPTPPRRRGGALTWDRQFPDRHIAVTVRCPAA